jgi:hypothetical protein
MVISERAKWSLRELASLGTIRIKEEMCGNSIIILSRRVIFIMGNG